ncbi:MAG TPA: hypothetical protein PLS95_17690 [Thermoanaerobaculales bacterium]|nr:hypothetical protein [Thermoanaerobaculales bacterium]
MDPRQNAENQRACCICVLIAIGVAAVLAYEYGKPWLERRRADQANRPTDITVDAATMLSDYRTNAAAADAFYKGQTVAVYGAIDRIDPDGTVWLGGMLGVRCRVASPRDVMGLRAGDTATLRGHCAGDVGMGPRIDGCVLVGH